MEWCSEDDCITGEGKKFAMKIRIPGWVNEQKDDTVEIKVNGEAVKAKANKGYVTVDRTWKRAML